MALANNNYASLAGVYYYFYREFGIGTIYLYLILTAHKDEESFDNRRCRVYRLEYRGGIGKAKGTRGRIMTVSIKKIAYASLILVIIFISGFLLSSDVFHEYLTSKMKPSLVYHIRTLALPQTKHYFLLPSGGYGEYLYTGAYSAMTVFILISYALLNVIFQPIFLCLFTPQALLNYALFPFFIYGSIKYFRVVPLLVLSFFALAFLIGLNGSVVEALIRHRIPCELIYILIGTAGFTGWITRS